MAIGQVPTTLVSERLQQTQVTKTTAGFGSAKTQEWPRVMESPLAWGATSMPAEDDYTLTLTQAEVDEVKAAVEHFNGEFRLQHT
jgi:hypothetical protein